MDRYATLRRGLVGAWCPFITSGGYTLPDLSPTRANGTLTNMGGQINWRASGQGVSLSLDGSDDHVQASSIRSLVNQWTFSCHFAASMTNKTRHALFSNSNTGNSDLYVHIESVSGSTCALNSYSGGKSVYLGRSSSFTLDTAWTHYAVTCDSAGTVAYYRNGLQIGTAGNTWSYLAPTGPACIGGIAGLLGIGFTAQGLIDDVRLYSRWMPAAEVALLASRRGIGLLPTRHRRPSAIGSQFWLRDAGTWKKGTAWIKVGGVWTKATPKLNVSGTWK